METPLLDFSDSAARAGFRLARFEVYNWGTFDQRVWRIEPRGFNALLTGDIGSGKSTLVDAMTTLLVAPQRITFNKAAGADLRERTLTSYVRGHFKTEKNESSFIAKPVFLRPNHSYSVLLGYFFNEGYNEGVTLAQVFWMRENQTSPERFYVVSDRALSIAHEFSDFGTNVLDLKKRLRKESGTLVLDHFVQYAAEFRRRMGIASEQVMELFYQTVSMKSVDNLTDFVRAHMLEETPVLERVKAICRDFENLNRAHDAVKKARDQIERLTPLISDCDRYDELAKGIADLYACRGALEPYFAIQGVVLWDKRIAEEEAALTRLNDRLIHDREALGHWRTQEEQVRQSLFESGGGRLETLAREIAQLESERMRRTERNDAYTLLCDQVRLLPALNVDTFHANRQEAQKLREAFEGDRAQADVEKIDLQIALRNAQDQTAIVGHELDSLRGRTSNISVDALDTRRRLCETLGFSETELPFAGELLKVHAGAAEWEGAIERVLHGFALSLLVPEERYAAVAHYVNATHLGNRLVYFRIRSEKSLRSDEVSDPRLLIHKLGVKPDSLFRDWLEQELARRFDYFCCETLEDFQREPKALTRQGQMKSQGRRHEKDDRHRLDDRSRYVLGWDNADKIQAFEMRRDQLATELASIQKKIGGVERRLNEFMRARDAVRDVLAVQAFQDIDWSSAAQQIENLKEEKRRLEEESDQLRALQASLAGIRETIKGLDEAVQKRAEQHAVKKEHLRQATEAREGAWEEANRGAGSERAALFARLDALRPEAIGPRALTLENIRSQESALREWIQSRHEAESKKKERLIEKITGQMKDYKAVYPLDTQEADANVEAAAEYRQMLARLSEEDLPRHAEKFRRLLNEGTINDFVLFQNQLDKDEQAIRERIAFINESLREIEYSPGTFIELVLSPTMDTEVRQFEADLRACLGGALSGGEVELYNEEKFLKMKTLIDRFNERPESSEADRRWTLKVTDVRHWSEYSATERWKETGDEKEFYAGSSGKSGGQKEKLAYTVLASALAYQFGLQRGAARSHGFRFVMIDEAFGRGSDESAHYALKLFQELNLQLLIVTPLQKTQVIEPYVHSVAFVHNEDGRLSKVQNLTIDAYREGKARFASSPPLE